MQTTEKSRKHDLTVWHLLKILSFFSPQMNIILPFKLGCANKAEKLCVTLTSCSVCCCCCYWLQVRISSWPKETPGSWFSEFKRGKMVSLFFFSPAVHSSVKFEIVGSWHCDININLSNCSKRMQFARKWIDLTVKKNKKKICFIVNKRNKQCSSGEEKISFSPSECFSHK